MTYLEQALEVLNKIESNGFKAYIVGGFVRDYLLNIESNDIDITTNASIRDLQNIFEHITLKGEKFDGAIININNYSFEITSFRKDISYIDHRHPIVEKAYSLYEDLKRRDFTINAMCLDKNLNVIDFYDGRIDLDNKTIRTIGNPEIRFNEDALRILRAFYFSAKLNFKISDDTIYGINQNAKFIDFLSGDRIKEELEKLLKQDNYKLGLEYLLNSEVINYLAPLKKGINLIYKSNIKFSFIELICLTSYLGESIQRFSFTKKETKFIKKTIELIDIEYNNYVLFKNDLDVLVSANKIKQLLNKNYLDDISLHKNKLILKNTSELDITALEISKYIKQNQTANALNYLISLVLDNKIENKKEILIEEIKRRYKDV